MTRPNPETGFLTDEQLDQAQRFVMSLYGAAELEHFNASSRRRTKCSCGDTWPCPHKDSRRAGIRLVESVITELMYRRKLAPLGAASTRGWHIELQSADAEQPPAAPDPSGDAAERLRLARQAVIADGYFTEDQVGDDVAPRITELLTHYRNQLGEPETEWGHQIVSDDGHRGDEVSQGTEEAARTAVRHLNRMLPPTSRAVLIQRDVRYHATRWREVADE